MIPTATPRGLSREASRSGGGFDTGNVWLYGTPTATVSPTPTGTPGPSPTPTLTPTPVNAATLKGQLLFSSSRPLPAVYAPAASNLRAFNPDLLKAFQGNGGIGTVWRFDPAMAQLAPCDPPAATPTPVPAGQPTPAAFFNLNDLTQRGASACQVVYETALVDQTFSADKRFEAYIGSDPNGGRPQVFVLDHSTQTRKMVTKFGTGVSYDPAFAPDGYHLVFISQAEGQDNVYAITRDGTDLARLTRIPGQNWTTNWEWIKRPTWSADGTRIAFWSNKVSGARQIWVMQADGSNLYAISNDPRPSEDWDPVWVR